MINSDKPTLIVMFILSLRHLGNLAKTFCGPNILTLFFYSNCYLQCVTQSAIICSKCYTLSSFSLINFGQVSAGWEVYHCLKL